MCNASKTTTPPTTTSTTRGTTTTTTTATTRGTTHTSQHFITDLPATATVQSGNVRHDFICHFATVEIFIPVSEAPNAVLRLRDPSCVLVNNGTHHVITFPFNLCGTSVTSFKDYSIVTNYVTVHTDLHVSAPVVFGDDYNISLECQVPEHMVLDGSFQAVTKEPAQQLNANTQMGFHLREYTSADYTQEITKYPVQVSINKEIFLEVTLADDTSRNTTLGVKVNECRATPSPDPHDSTSYLLIRDSCPATPAVHLQSSPSPETYRFSVQTFHFSGNTNTDDVVYIHCDVSICHDDKCGLRCGTSGGACRKRRSGLSKRSALGSTLTSGPHIIVNEPETKQ